MPVNINGKTFYRTQEAVERAGISRSTYFRWLRMSKIEDTKHKDAHGWRLFTEAEINKIIALNQTIKISK